MKSVATKTILLLLALALALPCLAAASSPVSPIERRVLAPGVAEYFFTVRVGSGPYDQIGVHRVVKETAPNVPAHAAQAVFLAHGDIWNFRAAFLTGGANPLPVFLAQNGVDVWGIDYRWTFVPATVTDLSFMKHWGLEQDARDLGVALGVARAHPRAHRQRRRQDLPPRLEPRRPDRLRLPQRRDAAPAGPAPGAGLHPGGHLPEDRRAAAPDLRLPARPGERRGGDRGRQLRGHLRES